MKVRLWIVVVLVTLCVLVQTAPIVIDNTIKAATFDGFGAVSGGGATSRLLLDYPEPQRSQILDYLFLPNFGASLHHLKVEIAGDADTTCGSEQSHMHSRDDESYNRGYEFWLMKEAKKRNPNIVLSGLQWSAPAWVNTNHNSLYSDDDITYVIKWIKGAKTVQGLDLSYISSGWNERYYNTTYIKAMRAALDSNGLSGVKIIAGDEWGNGNQWGVLYDMLKDTELMKAVDVIGVHVTGPLEGSGHGTIPPESRTSGKPVWQSEEHYGLPDTNPVPCWKWEAASDMAVQINRNYVTNGFTSTLMWSVIYSWIFPISYQGKGLMVANTPWSGSYSVSAPIWIAAHTTQFSAPGWKYLGGTGSGILPGSQNISYVTLVPPDGNDFSLVIETVLSSSPYSATFTLKGGLAKHAGGSLNLWKTNQQSNFEQLPDLKVDNFGNFDLNLDPSSIYTITSTTGQKKGDHGSPPPDTPFSLPYHEDFNSYPNDTLPKYWSDLQGAFSIYHTQTTSCGVLRQQAPELPILWGASNVVMFATVLGDGNWGDLTFNSSFLIEGTDNSNKVIFGVRAGHGKCCFGPSDIYSGQSGYFWSIEAGGAWSLVRQGNTLSKGQLATAPGHNVWHMVSFVVKNVNGLIELTGIYDNKNVFDTLDKNVPEWLLTGLVVLGTGFHNAQFDDISVT